MEEWLEIALDFFLVFGGFSVNSIFMCVFGEWRQSAALSPRGLVVALTE
jgi:hypothetical protein